MRTVLALIAVTVVLAGCGSAAPAPATAEKGVYAQQIDKARSTAAKETEKVRSGERDVYGG
jgi:uncharacterized protein YceK